MSLQRSCASQWKRKDACGTPSQQSRTSSPHGKCWCKAPTPERTTRCAHFHQASPSGTHKTTMTAFGQPWRPFYNESRNFARKLATLPMKMGVLGLRSATRCAAVAYWASWADALGMISQRNPGVADMVVRTMEGELPFPPGRRMAELDSSRFDREGFWWKPSWPELREGKRPPENTTGEPGEWQHGWQYWASSVSNSHFRQTTMLSVRSAASRAHLRSH